jgi:hypothetical protein
MKVFRKINYFLVVVLALANLNSLAQNKTTSTSKNELSGGAIAGITTGVVVVALIGLVLAGRALLKNGKIQLKDDPNQSLEPQDPKVINEALTNMNISAEDQAKFTQKMKQADATKLKEIVRVGGPFDLLFTKRPMRQNAIDAFDKLSAELKMPRTEIVNLLEKNFSEMFPELLQKFGYTVESLNKELINKDKADGFAIDESPASISKDMTPLEKLLSEGTLDKFFSIEKKITLKEITDALGLEVKDVDKLNKLVENQILKTEVNGQEVYLQRQADGSYKKIPKNQVGDKDILAISDLKSQLISQNIAEAEPTSSASAYGATSDLFNEFSKLNEGSERYQNIKVNINDFDKLIKSEFDGKIIQIGDKYFAVEKDKISPVSDVDEVTIRATDIVNIGDLRQAVLEEFPAKSSALSELELSAGSEVPSLPEGLKPGELTPAPVEAPHLDPLSTGLQPGGLEESPLSTGELPISEPLPSTSADVVV